MEIVELLLVTEMLLDPPPTTMPSEAAIKEVDDKSCTLMLLPAMPEDKLNPYPEEVIVAAVAMMESSVEVETTWTA